MLERFMSKVQITDTCWIWQASTDKFGYGWFSIKSKMFRAHRVAYELMVGPVNGLCVCHICDNPNCVNPTHLFLGTVQENNKDKQNKNRQHRPTGLKNPKVKLTEQDVKEIKKLFASGVPQHKLVKSYKVSQGCISGILTGRTWKHI